MISNAWRAKLPKKTRNLQARRDESPSDRTIPLPQQRDTKKVLEIGKGT